MLCNFFGVVFLFFVCYNNERKQTTMRSGIYKGGIPLKMTTTKIAELVGVSRGAVDKTIHGRPGVREDVRERILQVMEETGYVPLSERKKVQAKQSVKTVAVILPGPNNPYFTVLRRYLEELGALMPALQLVYFPCNTANAYEVLKILK